MTDPVFHKAALIPVEWCVICPVCDKSFTVDVVEADSGAYGGNGADQFPECECGALIEVVPVSVRPVDCE